jgi:lipoic acid synthetase
MSKHDPYRAPSRETPDSHQRSAEKLKRIPIKVVPAEQPLRKPEWIRVRLGGGESVNRVKRILRERNLHSVCEEAACPNLSECFGHGTATFMILGDICTRRCPFCDVAHGRPQPPDPAEPEQLAETIRELGLRYVVITSVDRDDLRDGGAGHFAACIRAIRERTPATRIEVLVPDFRGRMDPAVEILAAEPPDVFNHNLETVPRLYKAARPGADYQVSLDLLARFKARHTEVPTKSGLMLGLGETLEEVAQVMADLRAHGCDMLTLGQYLQPSADHFPVVRYATPEEFERLAEAGRAMGFSAVASAPLVRSSYHADLQAGEVLAG